MVKKSERAITDSRERTADILFSDVGTVASAVQCSDLSIAEDNFVPTAKCIEDTKKKQLVTRSSLQRLRGCVCHLHHEALYRVRQFFAKVLKKVQHYRVDVIAGDANAAAHKYYRKQSTKICTTPRLPSC